MKNQSDKEFDTADESDLEAILEIEQQSFNRPWNRISFLEELSHAYSFHYVVRLSSDSHFSPLTSHFPLPASQLIAYIFFHIIADEMEILKIAADPRIRGRGIGFRMVAESLRLAEQKGAVTSFLEVRESNRPAVNLYHKSGFQIIGRRPGYYPETKEDALVMMKMLKGGMKNEYKNRNQRFWKNRASCVKSRHESP